MWLQIVVVISTAISTLEGTLQTYIKSLLYCFPTVEGSL